MARHMKRMGIGIILASLGALFLFPILVTLTNSFMSTLEIRSRYSLSFHAANSFDVSGKIHFSEMSLIPFRVSGMQYRKLLLDSSHYIGLFLNSLKLVLPILIGQCVLSAPTAYVFEMSQNRFKETIYFVYIVIMLLPLQVTLVSNFIVADYLQLMGTSWPIILSAVCSPFGVFLIRQSIKGMPISYVEAAQLDGANHTQVFWYIALPMMKSAVAALAILTFVEYWNIVDQAVVFIEELVDYPMSVYLSLMLNEQNMTLLFAASCFYMLFPILVFLFGQEYMVEGIQLSGIK